MGVAMKPYHRSYWKTIVLAAGVGSLLVSLAVAGMAFGADLATNLGVQVEFLVLLWVVPVVLLVPAVFCFSVAFGGMLCLYKDITRAGRP